MANGIGRMATAALIVLAAPVTAQRPAKPAWIASWGTSQQTGAVIRRAPAAPAAPAMPRPASASPMVPYPDTLADQTIRMVVRVSAGGPRVRLEFTNAADGATVTFGAVHAARLAQGSSIVAASDRQVSFGGKPGLTLFPGATAVSDPIDLAVPALGAVAVSVYLPQATPTNTVHPLGLNPAFIAAGNVAAAATLEQPVVARSYFWLSGLSVPAARAGVGTIVALGDSITDGYATTPGAHREWPALLAERLQAHRPTAGWGVVNAGISGNRILKPGAGDAAVARFDADVLSRPGVKWVLMLEGINDINMTILPIMPAAEHVTADQIITGFSQLIARAHQRGIKIAGATIMPTNGLPFYSAAGERMRQTVNHWIRTSKRFDAVIDFDAVTRDPADRTRLRPDFDPGDHVHPNDAANRAMADAIDLRMFAR